MGCGTSSQQAMNPHEVDLTHFELLKVVGKGGFGKVNAVTKLDSNELMALKRMEKHAVMQSNNHLRMVWIERKIMSAMRDCHFLVHLEYAFQSPEELFLVMPFMQGGDLRYHLKERGTMNEETARFYAAEILLGLEALHRKHVVFRDLKPDNILLDAEGHIRVSDFGLACILKKEQNYSTTGQAGTRGYQAPEVIADQWYSTYVDIWSYGCTLYELLHGVRPFKDWSRVGLVGQAVDPQLEARQRHNREVDPIKHQQDIDSGVYDMQPPELHISSRLSPATHMLLRGLLTVDIHKRLGCGPTGWTEVKQHPFFAGIDWRLLAAKQMPPPIAPDLSRANCTADADLADQLLDRKPRSIMPEQQQVFEKWNFRVEIAQAEPTGISPTAVDNLSGASATSDVQQHVSTGTRSSASTIHHDISTSFQQAPRLSEDMRDKHAMKQNGVEYVDEHKAHDEAAHHALPSQQQQQHNHFQPIRNNHYNQIPQASPPVHHQIPQYQLQQNTNTPTQLNGLNQNPVQRAIQHQSSTATNSPARRLGDISTDVR